MLGELIRRENGGEGTGLYRNHGARLTRESDRAHETIRLDPMKAPRYA